MPESVAKRQFAFQGTKRQKQKENLAAMVHSDGKVDTPETIPEFPQSNLGPTRRACLQCST